MCQIPDKILLFAGQFLGNIDVNADVEVATLAALHAWQSVTG